MYLFLSDAFLIFSVAPSYEFEVEDVNTYKDDKKFN